MTLSGGSFGNSSSISLKIISISTGIYSLAENLDSYYILLYIYSGSSSIDYSTIFYSSCIFSDSNYLIISFVNGLFPSLKLSKVSSLFSLINNDFLKKVDIGKYKSFFY